MRDLTESHDKRLDEATSIELQLNIGLDAIQLGALRKADRVSFFHRAQPDATGETSYICATKENKPSGNDPFARESVVIIPCECRLVDYSRGDDAIPFDSNDWRGFAMIHAAQFHDAWKTITSLLTARDKLTLKWSRGAWTTESMKEATPKFYGDVLELCVARGGKTKSLTFHVETSICEDNSARMVRRA
jgi:hypothetical protein